jgi:prepilin signal peptidase PulO-like enzyme (type II secretory pathway)
MTGKVKKGQPIAFGPSIFVGTLIAYVYGINILEWYLAFW